MDFVGSFLGFFFAFIAKDLYDIYVRPTVLKHVGKPKDFFKEVVRE